MLLFIVEDRFFITGVGLLLMPGLGSKKAKVGDKLKLIKPDRTTIDLKITAITFNEAKHIGIGNNLSKEDIPIGTEVWLIE